MWPYHPACYLPMAERLNARTCRYRRQRHHQPALTGRDQEDITTQLTERTVSFIENKDAPLCTCRTPW